MALASGYLQNVKLMFVDSRRIERVMSNPGMSTASELRSPADHKSACSCFILSMGSTVADLEILLDSYIDFCRRCSSAIYKGSVIAPAALWNFLHGLVLYDVTICITELRCSVESHQVSHLLVLIENYCNCFCVY